MKPKEALIYFTGADYLKKHFVFEEKLLSESTGTPGPHLPFDGDLKTERKIYTQRLKGMFEYLAIVTSRITGVDAAIKKIRTELAKHARK